VGEEKRQAILDDVIAAITATDNRGLKLHAAAIEKDSELYGEHAVEAATEQVCKRFDTFWRGASMSAAIRSAGC